jgi:hypothetical protein
MIAFGSMSITLLIGVLQGTVIAILLLRSAGNRLANRYLALLILAFAALITPMSSDLQASTIAGRGSALRRFRTPWRSGRWCGCILAH